MENNKTFGEWLNDEIEELSPSDFLTALDRNRPYNGQPWTDTGERGRQEVKGLTMRDIQDCFIFACYDSADNKATASSIYKLDWEHIDPMAIAQNLSCWVERYMGIFPNIPLPYIIGSQKG